MSKALELTGKVFGHLTVVKRIENKGMKSQWLCLCDCGNECNVLGTSLTIGNTMSCGCSKDNAVIQLAGRRFGRLTVVSAFGKNHGEITWLCSCDCGGTKVVSSYPLRNGITSSCGCLESENRRAHTTKHGLSSHPLYQVWKNMKARCLNKNDTSYHDYGGRGISIHENWISDFKWFYDDCISAGWQDGLQIDRRRNGGNYEPGNIRFVTAQENTQNTRTTKLNKYSVRRIIEFLSVGLSPVSLAETFGVSVGRIYQIRSNKSWSNIQ